MSLRMFDFQCKAGHKHEALIPAETRAVSCPICGKTARRLLAAPRCQLEGITGAFPSASAAWEKRRESHMAKERKNMEKHGTYK